MGKRKDPAASAGLHLTTFYENGLRLNRIALSKKSDSAEYPSQTAYVLDEIFQRNQITVRAALGSEGIKAIVDGDEAHAQERENALQIVAGFLVVSAETG